MQILSNGLNYDKIYRKSIDSSREWCYWKHCQLELKDTEVMSNEKRPLGPQTSVGRKQAERIICLQMPIFFFFFMPNGE